MQSHSASRSPFSLVVVTEGWQRVPAGEACAGQSHGASHRRGGRGEGGGVEHEVSPPVVHSGSGPFCRHSPLAPKRWRGPKPTLSILCMVPWQSCSGGEWKGIRNNLAGGTWRKWVQGMWGSYTPPPPASPHCGSSGAMCRMVSCHKQLQQEWACSHVGSCCTRLLVLPWRGEAGVTKNRRDCPKIRPNASLGGKNNIRPGLTFGKTW